MKTLRGAFSQPAFVVAAVVLLAAALTLNGAVEYLKLYFKKEPVALRHHLDEIPAELGPWVQVSKDEPLDKEIQDVLGTEKYIFRDYVDFRQISESDKSLLKQEQSAADTRKLVARIQADKPSAVVTAAVTYYTGMVDTVAHVPDRCYVADGYEPAEYTTPTWEIADRSHSAGSADASASVSTKPLQVRLINFEDQTPNRAAMPINVAYFFHCNGSFESDPINGVRMRLQDLTEKHGYYAKVELKTVMRDRVASEQAMADFLGYALPEIENCLPDWQAVKRGEAHKSQ